MRVIVTVNDSTGRSTKWFACLSNFIHRTHQMTLPNPDIMNGKSCGIVGNELRRQGRRTEFFDSHLGKDDGFRRVVIEFHNHLHKGMSVTPIVGRSTMPNVPVGPWCLFRAPVEGVRQGKTVVVQLRAATCPVPTRPGTVKRFEREQATIGDLWQHQHVTLKFLDPDLGSIAPAGKDKTEILVIEEHVEVFWMEP